MITMAADELLTTAQAAKRIGISTTTLNTWARSGKVRPTLITPGGQRRWNLDDLRRQLQYWEPDEE